MNKLNSWRPLRHAALAIVLALAVSGGAHGQDEALAESGTAGLETKTIAVVRDGEDFYWSKLTGLVKKELEELSKGEYRVEFKDGDALSAGWDVKKAGGAVEAAIRDPAVDAVFAAGLMVTNFAGAMEAGARTKPVLGGAVRFADSGDFPVSAEGTSTVENFTFITSPRRVERDLAALSGLAGANTIHTLVDGLMLRESAEATKAKTTMEKRLGLSLRVVPAGSNAARTLESLPGGVRALYVTILPRFSDDELKKLYAGLAKRGVITLSMAGHRELEMGAMAALSPDTLETLGRRAAVSLHQILLGIPAESLPVYMPVEDRLVINMKVADAVGYSPDYETYLSAEFTGRETLTEGDPLTLEESMKLAASRNADVGIRIAERDLSEEDRKLSRSTLLPQLGSRADYGYRRTEGGRGGFYDLVQPKERREGRYGVELRQILLDDEAMSRFRAGKHDVAARNLDLESTRLDAMAEAGKAFLHLLSARSLYEIEKKNLRVTRNNLELAKIRNEVGAGDPQEIYRWEVNAAQGKSLVFQRRSTMETTMIDLNRVLGAPRDKRWNPKDITLEVGDLYFMDDALKRRILNVAGFQEFAKFLMAVSVRASLELKAFDESLKARGILLRERKRRFFLPKIGVQTSVEGVHESLSVLGPNDQSEWFAGASATFPLFEGGRRTHEVARQRAEIRKVEEQKEKALQFVEREALASVAAIGGSHPRIKFSRDARKSAWKNFDAVREKYGQGASSILDLLDAQERLLRQEQEASLAVYEYLNDIVELQRAISWFEFSKSREEKAEWIGLLTGFMKGGGLPSATSGPSHAAKTSSPPVPKAKVRARPRRKPGKHP